MKTKAVCTGADGGTVHLAHTALRLSLALAMWSLGVSITLANPPVGPLRLVARSGPTEFLDFTVRGTTITLTDKPAQGEKGEPVEWRLEGDLLGHANCFRFDLPVVITRSWSVRRDEAPEATSRIILYLDPLKSELTDMRDTDILVFVWLVRGEPALVTVYSGARHKAAGKDDGILLTPRRDQADGIGALLIWREGNFLPQPAPFSSAAANQVVHTMVLQRDEALPDALKRLRSINERGVHQRTLLHLAAAFGFETACAQLIKAGANLRAQDEYNLTPLSLAIRGGHNGCVTLLAARLPEPAVELWQGHQWAHEQQDLDLSLALLKGDLRRNPYNPSQDWLVRTAAELGRFDILDVLCDLKISVRRIPPETVDRALRADEIRTADALLRLGVKRTLHSNDLAAVLRRVASAGRNEGVRVLLKMGANPDGANAEGETALMLAASLDRREVVRQLLAAGANPDHRNGSGQTALHLAAAGGHPEIVRALIATQCKLDGLDRAGISALGQALRSRHSTIAMELAAAGAEIDVQAKDVMEQIENAVAMDCPVLLERALVAGWDTTTKFYGEFSLLDAATAYDARETLRWITGKQRVATSDHATAWPDAGPQDLSEGSKQPVDVRPWGSLLPSATINVTGVLDREGNLRFARVVSSTDARLNEETLRAAQHWQLTALSRANASERTRASVTVTFPGHDESVYGEAELDSPPAVARRSWLPRLSTATIELAPPKGKARDPKAANVSSANLAAILRRGAVESESTWADVRFVLERDGKVSCVEVLSASHPILLTSAATTIQQFEFTPALRQGRNVRARLNLRLE